MKSERFEMRVDADFLGTVDEWRRRQPDLPTRAEAIRRIVQAVSVEPAESADAPGERNVSKSVSSSL